MKVQITSVLHVSSLVDVDVDLKDVDIKIDADGKSDITQLSEEQQKVVFDALIPQVVSDAYDQTSTLSQIVHTLLAAIAIVQREVPSAKCAYSPCSEIETITEVI